MNRATYWVLSATPSVIGLLAAASIPIFVDQAGPTQTWGGVVLTALLGAWISVLTGTVLSHLEIRASERDRLFDSVYDRLISRMKPESMIQVILEGVENAPPITRWLASEISVFRQGRADLTQFGRWKISTARMYEAIVGTVTGATELLIIDQDFRRWREALVLPGADHGPNTSTTFNYSRSILHSLADGMKRRGGPNLKRILVFQEAFPPFTPEDVAACKAGEWKKLSDQSKILTLIWAVEEKINKLSTSAARLETRSLDASTLSSKDRKLLIEAQDFVIVDSTCCFLENITYTEQTSNTTSEKTESFVCALLKDDPAKIKDRSKLFDDLWRVARGCDQYRGVVDPVMKDATLAELAELCI